MATSSKFQSLTMSLLTAQLLTNRGVPPSTPLLLGIIGCGVTLDVDPREEPGGRGRDDLLVKQLEMVEHRPSFSELETE